MAFQKSASIITIQTKLLIHHFCFHNALLLVNHFSSSKFGNNKLRRRKSHDKEKELKGKISVKLYFNSLCTLAYVLEDMGATVFSSTSVKYLRLC